MANSFSNIKSGIEAHPVLASVIVGGVGLVATIYFMKRSKSSTSTNTQNVCTDSNGNIVDCNTGLPIGTSGGFSLQPTNNNSDILTAIGNLSQAIQNLIQNQNNPTSNPTPNPTPNPIPQPINGTGLPNPGTGTLHPGGGGGTKPSPTPQPIAQKRYVTVAQWSSTNTPWNSTLWGIAHHYGESLATIEKLNPQIKNPNLIYKGQKVYY